MEPPAAYQAARKRDLVARPRRSRKDHAETTQLRFPGLRRNCALAFFSCRGRENDRKPDFYGWFARAPRSCFHATSNLVSDGDSGHLRRPHRIGDLEIDARDLGGVAGDRKRR